jgi:hypothetical protein
VVWCGVVWVWFGCCSLTSNGVRHHTAAPIQIPMKVRVWVTKSNGSAFDLEVTATTTLSTLIRSAREELGMSGVPLSELVIYRSGEDAKKGLKLDTMEEVANVIGDEAMMKIPFLVQHSKLDAIGFERGGFGFECESFLSADI